MNDPQRSYKIAVISSVPPDPERIAGALILYRWLDHPQIDWTYIEPPVKKKSLFWRVLDRLTRTRFHRIANPAKRFYEGNDFSVFLKQESFFRHCLRELGAIDPDIILSVAHGPYYKTAYRVSKRANIPLILLAQDWWPAFPNIKPAHKHKEEQQFISICSDSAATIAVSEGMFKELGSPSNAVFLHDIPSERDVDLNQPFEPSDLPLKVIYAGNLAEYGPMIEKAALTCKQSDTVRLEVFGRSPIWWSAGMEDFLGQQGIYRGFILPSDFPKTANHYDCVLAAMSFDPELRQRMRTCFPSKIIELAQLGKPIVIWGPEDGSAVVWARKTGSALCVTDESPAALRAALEQLAHDKDEQSRLVKAVRTSASNEFNPVKIRQGFMSILAGVVRK